MNQETRYSYEKRIRELQSEVSMLRDYRRIARNIYHGCADLVKDNGTSIKISWILYQIGEALK